VLALLKPSAETIPQLDSLVWDHRRYLHPAPFARLPHLYPLQDGVSVGFLRTRRRQRIHHGIFRMFQVWESKDSLWLVPFRRLLPTCHTGGLLCRAFSMREKRTRQVPERRILGACASLQQDAIECNRIGRANRVIRVNSRLNGFARPRPVHPFPSKSVSRIALSVERQPGHGKKPARFSDISL